MRLWLRSEEGSEWLGRALGRALRAGNVVALMGPLGAGKTTLVRSVVEALGVDPAEVRSPSFTTALEYSGRLPIVHMDLYRHEHRLPDREWLAEMLDGNSVALVEWAEFLGDEAPADTLRVRIRFRGSNQGLVPEGREVEIEPSGPESWTLFGRLEEELELEPGIDGARYEEAPTSEGEEMR